MIVISERAGFESTLKAIKLHTLAYYVIILCPTDRMTSLRDLVSMPNCAVHILILAIVELFFAIGSYSV